MANYFSRFKLSIAIGLSAIVFLAGYLNQLNTGFQCFTELGIIFFGNMTFWLIGFPFIHKQGGQTIDLFFLRRNLSYSVGYTLINQVFTFFLLFMVFNIIYQHDFPIKVVSLVMTNHLLVNWFGYWIILAAVAYGKSKETKTEVTQKTRLTIKQNGIAHSVEVSDIWWISADNNCSWIKTSKGKYVVYKSLKSLLDILPENFIRIHKSTLYNVEQTATFETLKSGDVDITLLSGDHLRMSRNYKSVFKTVMPQVA